MKYCFLRYIAIAALMFCASQQAWSQSITWIGSFSNFKFTMEHQYGAGVDLWKEDGKIFGTFSYAQGLAGDTPTGLLENISFDNLTGKISFTAKLTTGMHRCDVHNNIYSRDLFVFNGVLKKTTMTGVLKELDALHQNSTTKVARVTLKVQKKEYGIEFKGREDWESHVRDIIQFRGPKW
jgi:hypothetical protein